MTQEKIKVSIKQNWLWQLIKYESANHSTENKKKSRLKTTFFWPVPFIPILGETSYQNDSEFRGLHDVLLKPSAI